MFSRGSLTSGYTLNITRDPGYRKRLVEYQEAKRQMGMQRTCWRGRLVAAFHILLLSRLTCEDCSRNTTKGPGIGWPLSRENNSKESPGVKQRLESLCCHLFLTSWALCSAAPHLPSTLSLLLQS